MRNGAQQENFNVCFPNFFAKIGKTLVLAGRLVYAMSVSNNSPSFHLL